MGGGGEWHSQGGGERGRNRAEEGSRRGRLRWKGIYGGRWEGMSRRGDAETRRGVRVGEKGREGGEGNEREKEEEMGEISGRWYVSRRRLE